MDITQPDTLIDRLVASYAPKESTFTVELAKGDVLTFRHPASADEFARLTSGAVQFASTLGGPTTLESWKEFVPEDKGIAAKAYFLHALSHEPKLSQLDCLKLAAKAPMLFQTIYNLVSEATEVRGRIREGQEVTELGKP